MTDTIASRVSVIVPTRNRSALLRLALASVDQLRADDLELEVIVADSHSTDETRAVAASFGTRVVEVSRDGPAAARNAGLRAATGEFIAFLDDDDVWLPGHLRAHIALMRARPDIDVVLGQARNTTPSVSTVGAAWPSELPDDGDLYVALLSLLPQIGATVARRSVLERVGYLDEDLGSDEDWDWHLRLALQLRVAFVPVPCVLFRNPPDGTRDERRWREWPATRSVFWRNVCRAGFRRASVDRIARIYLHHAGRQCGVFLRSTTVHVASGNPRAARRALLWAVRTSPLHVAWALVHQATLRAAVRSVTR